jgi:hypothetical protein
VTYREKTLGTSKPVKSCLAPENSTSDFVLLGYDLWLPADAPSALGRHGSPSLSKVSDPSNVNLPSHPEDLKMFPVEHLPEQPVEACWS